MRKRFVVIGPQQHQLSFGAAVLAEPDFRHEITELSSVQTPATHQSVPQYSYGLAVQFGSLRGVRQDHGEMGAPIAPFLVGHTLQHPNCTHSGTNFTLLTVTAAGVRPESNWYRVCRGSFIVRPLAKRIRTLAYVLLSSLLARNKAWPHRPCFIAHSSASLPEPYSKYSRNLLVISSSFKLVVLPLLVSTDSGSTTLLPTLETTDGGRWVTSCERFLNNNSAISAPTTIYETILA
jgi:hypothetical protein